MPYPLVLYPVNAVSATNALGDIALVNGNPGGSTNTKTSLADAATGFGEIWSQGNAGAWAAGALNLNIAPTGHGWFVDSSVLGGFTIAQGPWSGKVFGQLSANTATIDLYYRWFVYDTIAHTYTPLGNISVLGTSWTTTGAQFTFPSQGNFAQVAIANAQRLYFDLWGNITATTMVATNTIGIRISSTTVQGYTNTNVTAPNYEFSAGDPRWHRPRYVMRATQAPIITLSPPVPFPAWTCRAFGSTFIRPTTPGYVPLYLPRSFSATLLGLLPATKMAGTGTLTCTLSVPVALSATIAGAGVLSPTLTASRALPATTIPGVGTCVPTLQALPLFQSVVKNTLMNMYTFGWNAQAATKQHSGGYTLNTGGLYINWESAINWATYDLYFDVNQSSPDANTLLHGLLQYVSHDDQTCLQYLRSVALYKTAFPSDTSFDSANASGYMSVSAFTDHVTTDFAPQYTSGVYGGYSNPNGWVYWALLDCYLNLQGTGLLTPTQITNLQQSCLYAAFTFNTAWLEPTTGMFCETNANTYRPNNSLMMAAAVLDACKRWPGQITTGMFYYSGTPTQSVAIWQANALSTINAVLTRGAYNATYNVFVDAMNLVIGGTDTVNDAGCKASLIGETALALVMLYGLTGTTSYLTTANTLLQSIDSLLLDATNGGYYFSFNTSTGTTSTNSKESRATAHILRAYHYYNEYTSTYPTNEANVLTTLLTKFYKLVGGTGYNYRVKPDATFGSYTDNYTASYTSTLAAAVAIGDTGVQVNDWPSTSTTTCSATIAAGANTVTPASMAGIGVGDHLLITGGGGTAENITVTATTSTTFTATYVQPRTGTWTINVTFPDIVMCLDINATHEEEIVLSAYGTTGAAAPFTIPVNTAANGTGQFLKTHALSAPIQTVFMPITNVETTYTTEAMGGVLVDELATVTPIMSSLTTFVGVGTLSGTLSIPGALSVTLAGTGTLAGTLTEKTALTDTIAGVGTLTGTFTETTALTCTMSGIGTLTGTFTETTALSMTIGGVGTLTGSLTLTTALSTTIPGIGTLTGTLSEATALSVTIPGVGTLTGTFSLATALSTTLAGVGTLSGTTTLKTALTVSLSGTGTLSGVFSLRVALSLTFAAMGTISGIITMPVLSYLTATCVTRDMLAVARTRDMQATCTTRDERASALQRDMQATALTRDEQATAKTRS